jgi:hypothetical protein
MNGVLRLSERIYGALLLLYPPDLRHEFGPEMSELFREDLDDAWRGRGFAGAVSVWWCALSEVLRIALPGQKTNPAFVVPATSFAFSAFSLGSILAKAPAVSGHPLVEEIALVIVWPSLVAALTAVAVVHSGRVRVVSLDLNSPDDGAPCSKYAI